MAYDASRIKALKGLEGVRKRPAMYIGSIAQDGIFQIVKEVIDNSIDEVLVGRANKIKININTDTNLISIADNGRGIPPGMHEEGVSAITVVLTTLHAGGKFDHDAYKTSLGLHGVGVSCTNALSEYLRVEVKRDGVIYYQKFNKGVPQTINVEAQKESDYEKIIEFSKTDSGTKISFIPDRSIFNKAVIDIDCLKSFLRDLSYLNKSLKITFSINNKTDTIFKSDDGLKELLHYHNQHTLLHPEPLCIETAHYNIVVVWTNNVENGNIWSFVNSSFTCDGGTHIIGFKKAVAKAFKERTTKNLATDDINKIIVYPS